MLNGSRGGCRQVAPADSLDHFSAYLYHPHCHAPITSLAYLSLPLSASLCLLLSECVLCKLCPLPGHFTSCLPCCYPCLAIAWLSPFIDCFCEFLSVRKSLEVQFFAFDAHLRLNGIVYFFFFSFCVTFECRQIIHCGFECTAYCIHTLSVLL